MTTIKPRPGSQWLRVLMLAAVAGCMMKVNINFYDILFLYRRNYTLYNSSWRINSWLWFSWRQLWQVRWWWWWGVWRPGSWLIQEWDITELTDISDISSRHAIKQSINNNNYLIIMLQLWYHTATVWFYSWLQTLLFPLNYQMFFFWSIYVLLYWSLNQNNRGTCFIVKVWGRVPDIGTISESLIL